MKTAKMQALIFAIAAVMILSALASPITSSESSDSRMFLGNAEYGINVTYNEGGLVKYQTTVSEGKDALIIVSPNEGYVIEIVKLDGESFNPSSVSPDGKSALYVISNVQSSHSVNVKFKQEDGSGEEHYAITASAGTGGYISPQGSVSVSSGSSKTFKFTPNNVYEVDTLLVDGKTAYISGNSYTFENVTSNHTISVTFKKVRESTTYTITATAGSGGTITPSGEISVNNGADQTFMISPSSGYRINTVSVDGKSIQITNNQYTFSKVTKNHAISVTFASNGGDTPAPGEHTVTATAGKGGSINPAGSVKVSDGQNQAFTISVNEGYEIDTVIVNGNEVKLTGNTYNFLNVDADQSISVTFKETGTEPSTSGDDSNGNTVYCIIIAVVVVLIIVALAYLFLRK